jgi:hypothetical protein
MNVRTTERTPTDQGLSFTAVTQTERTGAALKRRLNAHPPMLKRENCREPVSDCVIIVENNSVFVYFRLVFGEVLF